MYYFTELSLQEPFEENGDIASSFLGELGFETFVEKSTLGAFVGEQSFEKEQALAVLSKLSELKIIKTYSSFKLQEKVNWNAKWEENFDPVLVPGLCYIRANFHEPYPDKSIQEIVITPKMSFGTGHHSTTRLMIQALSRLDLQDSFCLDMGTGTGILGIYALQRGAKEVLGIDNDEWCITNSEENREVNKISELRMPLILAEELKSEYQDCFDVVIANINRNVLLSQIPAYAKALKTNGDLLLSGFHPQDIELLSNKSNEFGLEIINQEVENDWVCLQLRKQ